MCLALPFQNNRSDNVRGFGGVRTFRGYLTRENMPSPSDFVKRNESFCSFHGIWTELYCHSRSHEAFNPTRPQVSRPSEYLPLKLFKRWDDGDPERTTGDLSGPLFVFLREILPSPLLNIVFHHCLRINASFISPISQQTPHW